MSDAQFQHALASFLLRADGSDCVTLPVELAAIAPTRLAVHRNTFVSTLVDMLAQTFPVTRALVGAEFFRDMARDCVLADPPRCPDLVPYALAFPLFVAGYSPVAATPFIPETAMLEAMRLRAFHAADAQALDPAAFRSLLDDPLRIGQTRVALHPSAQWLRARYAAHALWSAHDTADDIQSVDLAGLDLHAAQHVLVCRHGFELQVVALPAGAADFLDALAGGATFADAFARAIAADSRTEPTALFALLLQHGLAVALHENPTH